MPDRSTWPERAALVAARSGQPITEDMARNRHRRVLNDIELAKTTPHPESPIPIPAVPEGDFVGFTMAFWDIETTGLSAWNNDMTVCAITDNFGKTTVRDKTEFEQASILDDKGLVVWTRDALEQYDIIVAWYGTMFDIPFLNAKLIEHGERPMMDKMFLDPCFKTRGGRYGLKVGSSKLKNVAKWLNTPNQKPDVEWDVFRLGGYGDPESIATLRDRCAADTKVMRDIVDHIKPIIRTIHR